MGLNLGFAVTTWLWDSPLDTAAADRILRKLPEIGYDAVELAVEDPLLLDPARVRAMLDEYGLEPIVCGAFGPSRDLSSDDVRLQDNALKYIRTCLDLCVELGASFLAGPMYTAVGKARMIGPDERAREWERAVVNLRKVCAMAGDMGLGIALEPLNRFESDMVNTAADALRLIEDIAHPAAGVMLDGFHMNIEERDMEQAIKAAGDKLLHMQVSENYRGLPGSGQTDWQGLYRGLESIGYKGMLSIESFGAGNQELAGAVCIWKPLVPDPDQFAREGLAFLKEWAAGATEKR